MKDDGSATHGMERIKLEDARATPTMDKPTPDDMEVDVKQENGSRSASVSGGEAQPKAPRKGSQRTQAQQALLFDNLPDMTKESCENFQVITDCLYGSKNMGATDNDTFDCDCREEMGK